MWVPLIPHQKKVPLSKKWEKKESWSGLTASKQIISAFRQQIVSPPLRPFPLMTNRGKSSRALFYITTASWNGRYQFAPVKIRRAVKRFLWPPALNDPLRRPHHKNGDIKWQIRAWPPWKSRSATEAVRGRKKSFGLTGVGRKEFFSTTPSRITEIRLVKVVKRHLLVGIPSTQLPFLLNRVSFKPWDFDYTVSYFI